MTGDSPPPTALHLIVERLADGASQEGSAL